MVKRGFKSPYDFFTVKVEHQGAPGLLIMNGLLELHPVLSTMYVPEVTGFPEKEIEDFLDSMKGKIPFGPYEYQRRGIVEMLSGKNKCIERFATGSGKSLIISLMVEFLRQRDKKGILLVPNINLLTQF